MDDPMSKYEQCKHCGQYTDGFCCQNDYKIIHPVDALKDFIELTENQETELRKICDAEVCANCGKEL